MLKYTSVEHQDHKLLKLALQDIHELAVNINNIEKETEQVEKDIKKLREIETCIEGTVEVGLRKMFLLLVEVVVLDERRPASGVRLKELLQVATWLPGRDSQWTSADCLLTQES